MGTTAINTIDILKYTTKVSWKSLSYCSEQPLQRKFLRQIFFGENLKWKWGILFWWRRSVFAAVRNLAVYTSYFLRALAKIHGRWCLHHLIYHRLEKKGKTKELGPTLQLCSFGRCRHFSFGTVDVNYDPCVGHGFELFNRKTYESWGKFKYIFEKSQRISSHRYLSFF